MSICVLLARTKSSNVEPYLDMYAREGQTSRNSDAYAQGCTQITFQWTHSWVMLLRTVNDYLYILKPKISNLLGN